MKDIFGKSIIYKTTEYLLNLEKKMTDLMIELYNDQEYDDINNDIIENQINIYEQRQKLALGNPNFSFELEQRESVVKSVKNKCSIITGPPGTGKTEILKCINFVFSELYKKEKLCPKKYKEDTNKYVNPNTIGLLAPTGLAFINMQRSQNTEHYNINISGTCHRTLYQTVPNIKKHKRHCNCESLCEYNYDIGLFEIDEVSMLDMFVFGDILMACKYFNSRLILLGDVDQLPSIGAGQILFQLIKTNMFAVTKLKTIKRQNNGGLVKNILKMCSNQILKRNDFIDNSMILLDQGPFILSNNEINTQYLIDFINEHHFNVENTKFITNFNKQTFTFNTASLNFILQNIFNPIKDIEYYIIPSNHKYENNNIFRVGDKIIRTENDYTSKQMRANGEQAEIKDFDGIIVTIEYIGGANDMDKRDEISVDDLYENFVLNYCVTVHKSQGSQYPNVIYLIEPSCSIIEKKAIYTAISRAKERCIVISNETDFINSQKKIDNKVSLFMEDSDTYDI